MGQLVHRAWWQPEEPGEAYLHSDRVEHDGIDHLLVRPSPQYLEGGGRIYDGGAADNGSLVWEGYDVGGGGLTQLVLRTIETGECIAGAK